jgi:GNAT superfamily N-acetyltransferase
MATDDLPRINDLLCRLSRLSLQRRFFSIGPGGPRFEMRYLTSIDGHDRVALVAEADGLIVGVARFHRNPSGHADVAVVVDDAWQHHGVGSALMKALTRAAKQEHVDAFDMHVLSDNVPALGMMMRLAPRARRHLDRGVVEASVPLAG